MSLLLNIETSGTVCSVSVTEKGHTIAFLENKQGYTHAENLHVFIEKALKDAGKSAGQLNAVSVSEGPGSYTGLRIGVSTAKGLSYGLGIPLIMVNTLQIMANQALKAGNFDQFNPLLDARRMEVYTATFDERLQPVTSTRPLILDENSLLEFNNDKKKVFFGDGMPKCKTLLSILNNSYFLEDIYPSAEYMGSLSWHKFQNGAFADLAYSEPNYLKEFLITKSKK